MDFDGWPTPGPIDVRIPPMQRCIQQNAPQYDEEHRIENERTNGKRVFHR